MLRFLKIQNLAVIDEAELEVDDGFVCLTGESGAGKSVLIDALLLLAGNRASSDLVRSGCTKAVVEAEFELNNTPSGLELLDGSQLFLRREVTNQGKSRAFVNGVMVPANVLQSYGEIAFEIHGQHGQQRLLKARNHQHIFEEQVGLKDSVQEFERLKADLMAQVHAYWELMDGEAARLKEMDFIQLQLDEIDGADPDERDRDLDLHLKRARNRELIRANRKELHELLGGRLVPDLARLEKVLADLLEYSPELKPYLEEVVSAATSLNDLHSETRYWNDPGEEKSLAELEDRESALNRLFLKYGKDIDEVLAERIRLAQRLETLNQDSGGLEGRFARLEQTYTALLRRRQQLHGAREKAIQGFVRRVKESLSVLALASADFRVENIWPDWPEQLARERSPRLPQPELQFLFSSNPGEQVRPLARVASGGELSRVLLALISAFKRTGSRLLVFDEIDAGLGGETAHAAGARLAHLGRAHQVFCVTHFAQVARFAGQQIKIEKQVKGGRTFTKLVTCNHEQRIAELARLMGGDARSESLRDHARTLLEEQREKDPQALS